MALRRLQEAVHPHARHALHRADQLEALAVLAGKPHGNDPADAQGHQVIEHGARPAGLGPHPHDVEDAQAGLERGLRAGRIDLQVAIEAEVAQHGDRQAAVAAGDLLELRGSHGT